MYDTQTPLFAPAFETPEQFLDRCIQVTNFEILDGIVHYMAFADTMYEMYREYVKFYIRALYVDRHLVQECFMPIPKTEYLTREQFKRRLDKYVRIKIDPNDPRIII